MQKTYTSENRTLFLSGSFRRTKRMKSYSFRFYITSPHISIRDLVMKFIETSVSKYIFELVFNFAAEISNSNLKDSFINFFSFPLTFIAVFFLTGVPNPAFAHRDLLGQL